MRFSSRPHKEVKVALVEEALAAGAADAGAESHNRARGIPTVARNSAAI